MVYGIFLAPELALTKFTQVLVLVAVNRENMLQILFQGPKLKLLA